MKTRLLLVGLILLTVLAGCGPAVPEQPAEIRIGVISMLQEPYLSADGKWMNNGLDLAAKQINAAGGLEINGQRYQITLITEDDGGTPQGAAAAATRLINQQNVVAIIGPLYSAQALAAAQVAENARIPLITPTGTNPAVTSQRQYIFRVCFNDEQQGRALARYLRTTRGYNYAGLLYDISDAYNTALASSFREYFEAAGGRVLVEQTYTSDVTDFKLFMAAFKTPNLQVLVLPDYPEKVQVQATQAREAGLTVALAGGDAWDAVDPTLPALEGAVYSTHWFAGSENLTSQAFVEAYQKAYDELPNPTAALSYDALMLVVAAIRARNAVSPEAIAAGLQNLAGYDGVTGTISYTQGGDPIKNVVIMRIEGQKRVFVTTVRP